MTKQIDIINDSNYVPVLDFGFAGLIDKMGDDSSIVNAARVSYGKGTKSVSDDRNLIRYLMRNQHTSPFEMVQLKFHIKCPIFVMRQLIRHRTASTSEYSGRYSEMTNEIYMPNESRLQKQSAANKQGSDEELNNQEKAFCENLLKQSYNTSFSNYENTLKLGLTRELARIQLPLANYTEFYWAINLKNFFHFTKLRTDPHAQYEIRVVADAMYELIKPLFPLACEAFEDYWLNAKSFSAIELSILQRFLSYSQKTVANDFYRYITGNGKLSKREINEFLTKLGIDNLAQIT